MTNNAERVPAESTVLETKIKRNRADFEEKKKTSLSWRDFDKQKKLRLDAERLVAERSDSERSDSERSDSERQPEAEKPLEEEEEQKKEKRKISFSDYLQYKNRKC